MKKLTFEMLLSSKQSECNEALDQFVDDLNSNKKKTVAKFLAHEGSEDFLWALSAMMTSSVVRVASNAAYALGSVAESIPGSQRVFSVARSMKNGTLLRNLTNLLTNGEPECVMNAAGTLGTLAENESGRSWMLDQPCLTEVLENIAQLLSSENQWTASNAALVLARLTISERGCESVLQHNKAEYILTRLIHSLGNDPAGRGMNAAFAIGRLLDIEHGKELLTGNEYSEKMITSLCRMLCKGDMGGAKNACFAISCLARDVHGHQRIVSNAIFSDVMTQLVTLLNSAEDTEAAWFAAMTIRTIAGQKKGIVILRTNEELEKTLLNLQSNLNTTNDLKEEVNEILFLFKHLEAMPQPTVSNVTATSADLSWNEVTTPTGLEITYKLFCGTRVIYRGKDLFFRVEDLKPFTTYEFRVQSCMAGESSPQSEKTIIQTDESPPSSVTNLHVIGTTSTQIKVSWGAPANPNGVLKGYQILIGDRIPELTQEFIHIFSRLTPATTYTVSVCAANAKGCSERITVTCRTDETGGHAPSKPNLTVIGRNEIHASWDPPDALIGRFFRYELSINGRVAYQGTDKVYKATGLTPDTEHVFVVTAITSEGRCESEPSKKRTQRDNKQTEPGHHALKTHSFMAKEMQMQNKSKTQPNIILTKKTKKLSKRPSSSISSSNMSEISNNTDGLWAVKHNKTRSSDSRSKEQQPIAANAVIGGCERESPTKKSQLSAMCGGSRLSFRTEVKENPFTASGDQSAESSQKKTPPLVGATEKTIGILPLSSLQKQPALYKSKSMLSRRDKIRIVRPNHVLKHSKSIREKDPQTKQDFNIKESLKIKIPQEKDLTHLLSYYTDIKSPIENITLLEAALSGGADLLLSKKKFGSLDSLNVEPATHRSLDSLMDSTRSKKSFIDMLNLDASEKEQLFDTKNVSGKIINQLKDSKSKQYGQSGHNKKDNDKHRRNALNTRENEDISEGMSNATHLFKQHTRLLPIKTPATSKPLPPRNNPYHNMVPYPLPSTHMITAAATTHDHHHDKMLGTFQKFVGAHRPPKSQRREISIASGEFWSPLTFASKQNVISFDFQGPTTACASADYSSRKSLRAQVLFKKNIDSTQSTNKAPSKPESRQRGQTRSDKRRNRSNELYLDEIEQNKQKSAHHLHMRHHHDITSETKDSYENNVSSPTLLHHNVTRPHQVALR